jgi:hypothetical protein
VSQTLHHPCKIALNGALTHTLSIEQTYSKLPDFTSWDQTRRLREDGAAINDWADEKIKHAQRDDPYYGDYKDFLVQ